MTNIIIRYCQATELWADATVEDRKKYHKKLKESAKEHGFELILFGPAYGVIESPAWVLKTDKTFDDYSKWLGTAIGIGPRYFSASRTVYLVDAPWI
jgi:hypothetical protein